MVSSGKINKAGSALGLILKGIAVFSMLSATFIFLKDVDFRISFRDVNWANSDEVVQLVLFSGFMFCLFCALFCNLLYFISNVLMFLELNFRKENGETEYGGLGSGWQQDSSFRESANPAEDENYEYVDSETMQVRMQMIPLRVKIIDTLNLFVANLQMIPLIFIGLFFVVGGIAIVFQDNNPASLILSLMGVIPIVASIIPFRRDIQRFKEKYFGIVVKTGSPLERKQKLMDRIPALVAGGFFAVVGIFVLTINTPEDMSLIANILVRLSGGMVLAIGVFVAILVTKKK